MCILVFGVIEKFSSIVGRQTEPIGLTLRTVDRHVKIHIAVFSATIVYGFQFRDEHIAFKSELITELLKCPGSQINMRQGVSIFHFPKDLRHDRFFRANAFKPGDVHRDKGFNRFLESLNLIGDLHFDLPALPLGDRVQVGGQILLNLIIWYLKKQLQFNHHGPYERDQFLRAF